MLLFSMAFAACFFAGVVPLCCDSEAEEPQSVWGAGPVSSSHAGCDFQSPAHRPQTMPAARCVVSPSAERGVAGAARCGGAGSGRCNVRNAACPGDLRMRCSLCCALKHDPAFIGLSFSLTTPPPPPPPHTPSSCLFVLPLVGFPAICVHPSPGQQHGRAFCSNRNCAGLRAEPSPELSHCSVAGGPWARSPVDHQAPR